MSIHTFQCLPKNSHDAMLVVLVFDFLIGGGKDKPNIDCRSDMWWMFVDLHTLTK